MLRVLLLCVLLFPGVAASAADGVERGAEDRAERAGALPTPLKSALSRLSETEGFSCEFRQMVYFSEGDEQHFSGTLAVKRPGRFRWEYRSPYKQLYVSAGDVIWHYEPDLMQAERMLGLDVVDPIAMKLLDGRVALNHIQLLATEKSGAGDLSYRILVSDGESGGPELLVNFLPDGTLRWLESEDVLGNRNRMILLKVDRTLPAEKLFSFTPPEGVEVVDIAGGEGLPEGR